VKATYKNIVEDLKKDNIIQYNRIYDCLIAMIAVQDNNPDQYNDVLNALIQKARDLIEEGLKELHKRRNV